MVGVVLVGVWDVGSNVRDVADAKFYANGCNSNGCIIQILINVMPMDIILMDIIQIHNTDS